MKYSVAIIQNDISRDKSNNLKHIEEMIVSACKKADILVLPEMFNCPYNGKTFHKYAETYPGESTIMLKRLAETYNCLIVGGSIPELDGEKIFNTTYVFDQSGLVAKYRKSHLFDVDIPDGIRFIESDFLGAGNETVVFDYKDIKIGLSICYDIRFPEMARTLVNKGADVVIVPAAFNTTTGPAHWHVTSRARAIDNQVYYILASPARSEILSYKAYGHSLMVNPWGEITCEADISETIIYGEIDTNFIKKTRRALPLLAHRKREMYDC